MRVVKPPRESTASIKPDERGFCVHWVTVQRVGEVAEIHVEGVVAGGPNGPVAEA
jgi:hypothetical protein